MMAASKETVTRRRRPNVAMAPRCDEAAKGQDCKPKLETPFIREGEIA